ncbi:hypothetical protein GOBAR_AA24493 [Gossypium barbadense]|uniref:Uncharacterized protein n=1 Tax=Gossypium barbadense TaxID=3634 RepID=A0A2P5WYK7_GOSBA|nr:hypothetical protein GOBAR_AA24493 [Gossypium barbadense]
MSPQGISSMLHMRMIEHRCGVDLPQYRLVQSAEEEEYRLSHHPSIVQFMQQLHTLTSLSALLDLSSSVFSALITLMLLYIRFELETPLEKVLHNCHVLPDHHDNLFVGHCGCGTQPLPPPEYPPPI